MGPKIFTVRDANEILPELDRVFSDFDRIRDRLRILKSKTDLLELLWGEEIGSPKVPDHLEYQHYLEEIDKSKSEFDAGTRRITALEVVIKSVEHGLVDFYGVIDSRLVFLCWKRGEKLVEHFHHIDDGFSGRRSIVVRESEPRLD